MLTYKQKTGELFANDQHLIGTGYSGHGAGLNNPEAERQVNFGPIPHGLYIVGSTHIHPGKGVDVMTLAPHGHDAYGRTGFLIHGTHVNDQHDSSHGCIVIDHPHRIAADLDCRTCGERLLKVEV